MDRSAKITLLSFLIVAGFALGVGYHYAQGVYLGRPYPWNTFLFLPDVRFSDFSDVLREGHTLDPYGEFVSAQYPFLALLGYLLSLVPRSQYEVYISVVSSMFLLFSGSSLRLGSWAASATHIFVITCLSYPFLFVLDRGNFEGLVLVLLLAFVFFFTREKHTCSALCLGLAIALKLYPAIMLALYLPGRRIRSILLALGAAAAITIVSLVCFRGGFWANASFLLSGSNVSSMRLFADFTSISGNMVQRGVSLLTLLKLVAIETGLLRGVGDGAFLTWYLVVAGLVGVLVVADVVLLEKELWRRTALLVFAMLLLPHISADYKLLHVYLPLFLFVNCDKRSRLDLVFLVGFGLLLIPKDYHYFSQIVSDARGANDISIAVPINILTMVLMSALIILEGCRGAANRFLRRGRLGGIGRGLPNPGARSPTVGHISQAECGSGWPLRGDGVGSVPALLGTSPDGAHAH